MRAVVVYESMYGNTHVVAGNIADGLRAAYEVTLVPVAEASEDLVAEADLLIVGGPTHMHGLSSSASRRTAAQAAAKPCQRAEPGPRRLRPGPAGLAEGPRRRTRPGGRLRHPAQRRLRVHRRSQPGHRQAAAAARLPGHRRPGELPGQPAEHAARRRGARARRWGVALGVIASNIHLPARGLTLRYPRLSTNAPISFRGRRARIKAADEPSHSAPGRGAGHDTAPRPAARSWSASTDRPPRWPPCAGRYGRRGCVTPPSASSAPGTVTPGWAHRTPRRLG